MTARVAILAPDETTIKRSRLEELERKAAVHDAHLQAWREMRARQAVIAQTYHEMAAVESGLEPAQRFRAGWLACLYEFAELVASADFSTCSRKPAGGKSCGTSFHRLPASMSRTLGNRPGEPSTL